MVIYYNGDAIRCYGGKKMGNLFDRTIVLDKEYRPCDVDFCSCPYHGMDYSSSPTVVKDHPFLKEQKYRAYRLLKKWHIVE